MRVGLCYDTEMLEHTCLLNAHHPEEKRRISCIFDRLQATGLAELCDRVPCRVATDTELLSCHHRKHVEWMRGLEAMSQDERNIFAQQFNSIFFSRGSTRAALLAAGSTAELCHRICDGTLDRGFAVVRPPGHHCEINQPMGFCLFNNVAIACHTAIRAGLKRILIVDWDVHHGNGTQAMFKDREDVLFISIHRGRFYPGQDTAESHYVGEGKGAGFTVNVPWPSGGYGDADYELVWSLVVLPLARQFDPELVLVSAGFDAAAGDPLGGCKLSPDGYGRLTRGLLTVANGKMLQVLEGGYNLQVIPLCAEACVANMLQSRLESDKEDCAAAWWDTEEPGKDAQPGALETVAEVIARHEPYWPCLSRSKESLSHRRESLSRRQTAAVQPHGHTKAHANGGIRTFDFEFNLPEPSESRRRCSIM